MVFKSRSKRILLLICVCSFAFLSGCSSRYYDKGYWNGFDDGYSEGYHDGLYEQDDYITDSISDSYNEGYADGLKEAYEYIRNNCWLPMAEDGAAMVEEHLHGYESEDYAEDGVEQIRSFLSSLSHCLDRLSDGYAY